MKTLSAVFLIATLAHAAALSTPAELAIKAAEEAIAANGKHSGHYNSLAIAYARRARETADPEFYVKGHAAADRSLALEPDNFEGLKARTWLLLGQHRFAEALELARKLNQKMPDDVLVYGFVADACIELGQYAEAEKAAQWMLDLRPGNIAGLTRGSYLRELFGDVDGAIDLMNQALRRFRPEETEDRAWTMTHIGHLLLAKGDTERAGRVLEQALTVFPDYHYALGNLAKVRQAQSNHAEAVKLFEARYKHAPHPENLYDLAVALKKAGRTAEAATQFRAFEKSARAEMNGPDNSNRELIFYYLDHSKNPAEGLRIAKREIGLRQDIHTVDAYAWALYRTGQRAAAQQEIAKALAVGTADKQILAHSQEIRTGAVSAKRR